MTTDRKIVQVLHRGTHVGYADRNTIAAVIDRVAPRHYLDQDGRDSHAAVVDAVHRGQPNDRVGREIGVTVRWCADPRLVAWDDAESGFDVHDGATDTVVGSILRTPDGWQVRIGPDGGYQRPAGGGYNPPHAAWRVIGHLAGAGA